MTDKALASSVNGNKSESYYQDCYREPLATMVVFCNPRGKDENNRGMRIISFISALQSYKVFLLSSIQNKLLDYLDFYSVQPQRTLP